MNEWQTMETAPRDETPEQDGTPILAYIPDHGIDVIMHTGISNQHWIETFGYGEWALWSERRSRVEPTHWMPLPAPPSMEEQR
jgi:hypothetical protein